MARINTNVASVIAQSNYARTQQDLAIGARLLHTRIQRRILYKVRAHKVDDQQRRVMSGLQRFAETAACVVLL